MWEGFPLLSLLPAFIPGKAEQMGVQEATDADGLGWGEI